MNADEPGTGWSSGRTYSTVGDLGRFLLRPAVPISVQYRYACPRPAVSGLRRRRADATGNPLPRLRGGGGLPPRGAPSPVRGNLDAARPETAAAIPSTPGRHCGATPRP